MTQIVFFLSDTKNPLCIVILCTPQLRLKVHFAQQLFSLSNMVCQGIVNCEQDYQVKGASSKNITLHAHMHIKNLIKSTN